MSSPLRFIKTGRIIHRSYGVSNRNTLGNEEGCFTLFVQMFEKQSNTR